MTKYTRALEYLRARIHSKNEPHGWLTRYIDDHRPHILIYDSDGNAHVVPESFMNDVVEDKRCITELESWEYIVPVIIKERLNGGG